MNIIWKKTLLGAAEFDIGMVLYQLYKDQYRCASIKHKIWYEFNNHKWSEIDSGITLRMKISKSVSPLYLDKTREITDKLALKEEHDEDYTILTKKSTKYSEIGQLLRHTTFNKML